jgi:hypothetical protein
VDTEGIAIRKLSSDGTPSGVMSKMQTSRARNRSPNKLFLPINLLERSWQVLVLYLERPATQRRAFGWSLAGRSKYSDLKEAALTEAYVLCIALSVRGGMKNRLSWVGCDGLKAGWNGAVARRGLMWKPERPACEVVFPDETRNLRARRSTSRSRVGTAVQAAH